MLKLIDYSYYTSYYGDSSIPESSFYKYSMNASSRIHLYTSNRIKDENFITDDIRNATCEIANLLFSQDELIAKINDDTRAKSSETVGPHSVSYENKSSLQSQRILTSKELEQECYSIALRFLAHTGLMYRG